MLCTCVPPYGSQLLCPRHDRSSEPLAAAKRLDESKRGYYLKYVTKIHIYVANHVDHM